MAQVTKELVLGAYNAQARGDLDSYLGLLSDDFQLHIPGRSQIAGTYVGRNEIRRHFEEIAQLSGGSFSTSVHDVLGSDHHAVGLIEAEATGSDGAWSLPRVHVWHSQGGRLTRLWLHPADQYAFDAYWGRRGDR
jgi:uncharacterized protein